MKRFLLAAVVSLSLCGSMVPQPSQAQSAGQTSPIAQETTVIYQISADGKTKKVVGQLPMMHRASISPSGRYVYAEKIGYGPNDPTLPYLYDLQTKKLTQLSGFAKWSPKQDMLYICERGGIVRFNPADGKKSVLVQAVPMYPVIDFLVSPDEQYMAFSRMDEQSKDPGQQMHLYLQDLPTLKMKINDRYAWQQPTNRTVSSFYWMPNSKKLFYRTKAAFKELDLPTGLKYVHNLKSFPSYSSDLKYRYVREEKEEYLLDLQTGKKVILKREAQPIMEGTLSAVFWSPVGHAFAAEQHVRTSNAGDAYYMIQSQNDPGRAVYPFGALGTSKFSPYLNASDNVRMIGWAKDGKSFYVADLASVYYAAFAPDKLDEFHNVLEK